jgi:hypothetical protein
MRRISFSVLAIALPGRTATRRRSYSARGEAPRGAGPLATNRAPTFGRNRTPQAPGCRQIRVERYACQAYACGAYRFRCWRSRCRPPCSVGGGRPRHGRSAARGGPASTQPCRLSVGNELDRRRAAARFASKGMLAKHMHTAHIVFGGGDRPARGPDSGRRSAPGSQRRPCVRSGARTRLTNRHHPGSPRATRNAGARPHDAHRPHEGARAAF